MATLEAINPLSYITDWTPIPATAANASGWFQTEYSRVDVDEDEKPGNLPWFLAQGWTVYAVTSTIRIGGKNPGVVRRHYYMSRRKLQSDRVLQTMINEFTSAYNEGRLLNDRRYDEILALYDVMLSRSETEVSGGADLVAPYDAIVDTIIGNLESQFDEYEAKVDGLVDGYGDSHRTRINTQFDNELSKAQQALVNRGLHNATIWASVSAGIEQKRAESLTDLEDKILDRSLNVADRVQSARNDMNTRLESAAVRLRELKRSGKFDTSDFRNKILTAMLAFMERRTDEYPGVGELANIAAGLGYGEGSSVPGVISTS